MIRINKHKSDDIMYIGVNLDYNAELVENRKNAEFYIRDLELKLKNCNEKFLGTNWDIYLHDGMVYGELYFESPYINKKEAADVMDIIFNWLKKWFAGKKNSVLKLSAFSYYNRDNQEVKV